MSAVEADSISETQYFGNNKVNDYFIISQSTLFYKLTFYIMFLGRSFYDAKQKHASGEKYHIVSGPGNYNANLCSSDLCLWSVSSVGRA